jgi:hypothetical protein
VTPQSNRAIHCDGARARADDNRLAALQFCTYFDSNYLLRGLTMYRSLRATSATFVLHILALDDATFDTLTAMSLPDVKPIRLSDIEAANPELHTAKTNRGRIEYYFTLTPVLPAYLLERHPDIDVITYLDADLFFYASPDVLLEELRGHSILTCEHRYPERLRFKLIYGRFNVQFQSFRRDPAGLACLARWRAQCIEWCHDYVDGPRYADQKYLDEWPQVYGDALAIVQNLGAGVAPWNWSTQPMILSNGSMTIGGQPLVFYHFHGLKIFGPHLISNGLSDWGLMPFRQRRWIYANYVRRLRETRRWVQTQTGRDFPLRDRFARGKGVSLASAGEILRKAWSQAMIVP